MHSDTALLLRRPVIENRVKIIWWLRNEARMEGECDFHLVSLISFGITLGNLFKVYVIAF